MGYEITGENYFDKKQPAKSEELKNTIEVISAPYVIQDWKDDLYKSGAAIPFSIDEQKTIQIRYSSIPVRTPDVTVYGTDSSGTITRHAITGEVTNNPWTNAVFPTYYAWGADVDITRLDAESYCVIFVSGYELKPMEEINTSSDSDSILKFGPLVYRLKKNHLIQDRILAAAIADDLLDSYKTERKDVTLDWRGNMSLELNDLIEVYQYKQMNQEDFSIYKQNSEFDGAFKQNTEARVLPGG